VFRQTEAGSAEGQPVRDNGTDDAVFHGDFTFACLLGGEGVFVILFFTTSTALLSCLKKPDVDFFFDIAVGLLFVTGSNRN
jgi:hypothetical protein